jgi:protein-S-isoprenylcysteine O-methyltransferase Ste14
MATDGVASVRKRSTDASRVRDRGSLIVVVILWGAGIVLDFLLSFFLPQAAISWKRSEIFFIGITFMLAGISLRLYAMALLGRYFTFDVAIHSGQQVIEAGPYRYVRHPSYTGALLTLTGFGLALGNLAGLLVAVACLGFAYSYRIPVEEAALLEALGDPYQQYRKRTWRLVPFLY